MVQVVTDTVTLLYCNFPVSGPPSMPDAVKFVRAPSEVSSAEKTNLARAQSPIDARAALFILPFFTAFLFLGHKKVIVISALWWYNMM